MKITLKNIGMLDEAEFEVGDLTIICGENNTGKTYATYSLYGYLDFIKSHSFDIFDNIEQVTKKYSNNISIEGDVVQIKIDDIEKIIKEIIIGIQKIYKTNLHEILAGKESDFENSIFIEEGNKNFIKFIKNIKIKENKKNIINVFKYSTILKISEINEKYIYFNTEKSKSIFIKKIRKDALISYIFINIYLELYPNVFILSAERTGASIFEKEIFKNKSEIVEGISKADTKNIKKTVISIFNDRYSRYPKPVEDNINYVYELDKNSKKTSFIKKEEKKNTLYKEIIDLLYKIVGGKYSISKEGIEFSPKTKQGKIKKKFLIQRASSSVRSLLILNYYILHEARKGNILMIDEPELNLHPANQILMGRLIALLVNAGIKVFITTHSDYIVREIGNCIILNNFEDEEINKNFNKKYSFYNKLKPEDVKAYIAKYKNKKNILEPVKISKDSGILMETFNDVIRETSQLDNKLAQMFLGNKK